ncbi:MAG TPA: NAD(P)/FAD-dependent oxidoreductase [Deltaproteobacteria bacterium]|nr:NAD(P)/FAD-dependent oxidoreductase [Deltaproteobacteria bacterium]
MHGTRIHEYDVVIAGCGPAGATAGALLARSGVKVALVDRCTFPRPKLCGGLLSGKTMALLGHLFGETLETLSAGGIIDFVSREYSIHWKNRALVRQTSDVPFILVKRNVYDRFLLEKARSAGAEIMEGHALTRVDADADEVFTSPGMRLKARFIIGADGCHSVVRRSFPMYHGRHGEWSANMAVGMEVAIPRNAATQDMDHPCVHLGYLDWGYAWAFPNADSVIVGLGGLVHKNKRNFKDILATFLFDRGLISRPDEVLGLHMQGHPIPYGNEMHIPVYKDLLLVGDAAGLADPITGEGIYQAQKSAEMAAQSILQALGTGTHPLATYPSLLRKALLADLRYARALRVIVFSALKFLPPRLIGCLVAGAHRRALGVIHGTRGYPFTIRFPQTRPERVS